MKRLAIWKSFCSTICLLAVSSLVFAPALVFAEETGTPIGLSSEPTAYLGARVLRSGLEVFGAEAAAGPYAEDEDSEYLDRYSYWQGDTLFFGAQNSDTGNTVDAIAEFYWFESSVPLSSDFYVIVLKVKSAPDVINDYQLTQEGNWLDSIMYSVRPCQMVDIQMAAAGSAGAIRFDHSIPFQNYTWEPVKTIEIEEGFSAGFEATATVNGSAGAAVEAPGGYLKDITADANIQTKGYFNKNYSVSSKYTVTLYKWQMLVNGGGGHMTWNLLITEDGSVNNDSAYHEYFVVIQSPHGQPVQIDEISIGANFRNANMFWFDWHDKTSITIKNVEFIPPLDVECYTGDTPDENVCPSAGVCLTAQTKCKNGLWNCAVPPNYEGIELTCDGKDNDCDGAVDEDLSQNCVTDCGSGVQSCVNGKWSECSTKPSGETCDNLDNDCDGSTDEGLTQACTTACGTGVEMCKGGGWLNCSAAQPTTEACDGLDNDCDGIIDNPPACVQNPPNNNNNPPVTTITPPSEPTSTGCTAGDTTSSGWILALFLMGLVIIRRREGFTA